MTMLTTILSFLVLIIVAFVIFFALRSRGSAQNPGIRGDIRIENDCDGQVASIPANVKVSGNLHDDRGNSVGDTDNVGPLGVDPQGRPIKRGTYNLNVTLPANWGTSEKWVLTITKNDGSDICRSITCPLLTDCKNLNTHPIVVNYSSWAMTKEIKVTCSCN